MFSERGSTRPGPATRKGAVGACAATVLALLAARERTETNVSEMASVKATNAIRRTDFLFNFIVIKVLNAVVKPVIRRYEFRLHAWPMAPTVREKLPTRGASSQSNCLQSSRPRFGRCGRQS